MAKKNILLLVLVVVLAVVPLLMNKGAEFGGADGQAEEAIGEIHPNYQPWFESFWEPPSGEIESLLFALQAAIGTGFIAFFFGYFIGKKKGQEHAAE
jgi:cobalt/nickel transport protein